MAKLKAALAQARVEKDAVTAAAAVEGDEKAALLAKQLHEAQGKCADYAAQLDSAQDALAGAKRTAEAACGAVDAAVDALCAQLARNEEGCVPPAVCLGLVTGVGGATSLPAHHPDLAPYSRMTPEELQQREQELADEAMKQASFAERRAELL